MTYGSSGAFGRENDRILEETDQYATAFVEPPIQGVGHCLLCAEVRARALPSSTCQNLLICISSPTGTLPFRS
jgi:hypothetical protein